MDKDQSTQILQLLETLVPVFAEELKGQAEALRSAPSVSFSKVATRLCGTILERLFDAAGVAVNDKLDSDVASKAMHRIIRGMNSVLSTEYPYRICLHIFSEGGFERTITFGIVELETLRREGMSVSLSHVPIRISDPALPGLIRDQFYIANDPRQPPRFNLN